MKKHRSLVAAHWANFFDIWCDGRWEYATEGWHDFLVNGCPVATAIWGARSFEHLAERVPAGRSMLVLRGSPTKYAGSFGIRRVGDGVPELRTRSPVNNLLQLSDHMARTIAKSSDPPAKRDEYATKYPSEWNTYLDWCRWLDWEPVAS